MTIYAPPCPAFTCAICAEAYDPTDYWQRLRYGPTQPIPPLCNDCSHAWGTRIGGIGDLNRDRRIIRQISALAAAIETEAYRAQRGEGPIYGRA